MSSNVSMTVHYVGQIAAIILLIVSTNLNSLQHCVTKLFVVLESVRVDILVNMTFNQ